MQRITKDDRITEVWMQVIDHKRIAKLMAIQDVSHRELARVIGWKSHSYVGRIIRGEIGSVDTEAATKIAVALGVGVDDLFLPRASTVRMHDVSRQDAKVPA